VDVSDKGRAWGVNRNQDIFRYRRTGNNWQHISGKAIQVSVGESGVWVVNQGNDIFYRQGTYGDVDTEGSSWVHVGGKLKWIASGRNIVVGCNSSDQIFYRTGMSAATPTGETWLSVQGALMQIDVQGDVVVGVNKDHAIFKSDVHGN